MINKINSNAIINAKKRLLKMHYESGVGHIGGNLSVLECLLVLFAEFKENNEIILSKGHGAGALYIALWHCNFLAEGDLKKFHADDTTLPGHPPTNGKNPVPFGTGSLGHGLSLAAGTALAFKLKKINNEAQVSRCFCVTSDGEWQEGSTWEALIFAQHHKLSNLTIFIDHNNLQGFGSTDEVASMSPLWDKFSGFNVTISIIDGHSHQEIRAAVHKETKNVHIVCMKTVKGNGITFMENKMEWHYLPLDQKKYEAAIKELIK
jgi:transketolase